MKSNLQKNLSKLNHLQSTHDDCELADIFAMKVSPNNPVSGLTNEFSMNQDEVIEQGNIEGELVTLNNFIPSCMSSNNLLIYLCETFPDVMNQIHDYIIELPLFNQLVDKFNYLNNKLMSLETVDFVLAELINEDKEFMSKLSFEDKLQYYGMQSSDLDIGIVSMLVYMYVYDLLVIYSQNRILSADRCDEINQFATYVENGLLTILKHLDNRSKAVVFTLVFSSLGDANTYMYSILDVLKKYVSNFCDSEQIDLMIAFNDWLKSPCHDTNFANGLGAFYQTILICSGLSPESLNNYSDDKLNDILIAIVDYMD